MVAAIPWGRTTLVLSVKTFVRRAAPFDRLDNYDSVIIYTEDISQSTFAGTVKAQSLCDRSGATIRAPGIMCDIALFVLSDFYNKRFLLA